MYGPWTGTKGGECNWEGVVCRVEGNNGGKWDDCNNIINKIYFLKNGGLERRDKMVC